MFAGPNTFVVFHAEAGAAAAGPAAVLPDGRAVPTEAGTSAEEPGVVAPEAEHRVRKFPEEVAAPQECRPVPVRCPVQVRQAPAQELQLRRWAMVRECPTEERRLRRATAQPETGRATSGRATSGRATVRETRGRSSESVRAWAECAAPEASACRCLVRTGGWDPAWVPGPRMPRRPARERPLPRTSWRRRRRRPWCPEPGRARQRWMQEHLRKGLVPLRAPLLQCRAEDPHGNQSAFEFLRTSE